MRKVTNILLLWFPDQQASCCSHHYILFRTVQRLCNLALNPPRSAHHPEQEADANLQIHFSSLPAVPHPHLDRQMLRGWGAQDRDGVTAAKLLGLVIGGKKTLVLIKSGALGS